MHTHPAAHAGPLRKVTLAFSRAGLIHLWVVHQLVAFMAQSRVPLTARGADCALMTSPLSYGALTANSGAEMDHFGRRKGAKFPFATKKYSPI